MCDRLANLVQERRLEPEVVLVQHRLDHHELRRVQQRLVQATRLELRTLALQRLSALAVESVHLPHGLVAEQVLEGVAAKAASRPSDDNDLLAGGPRDEVLRASGEVSRVLLDVLPQVCWGVRRAGSVGADSAVDGTSEGGDRRGGEDDIGGESLGSVLVRLPERAQDRVADVCSLETEAYGD